MSESQKHPLKLVSIQELLDARYSFYVPAYQRGYRWKSSNVRLLIEDLLQFRDDEDKRGTKDRCPFYSLQSVVLRSNKEGYLEVIDGQQRLTTVLIILQALHTISYKPMLIKMLGCGIEDNLISDSLYSIKYETRECSEKWLAEITKSYLVDSLNDSGALGKLKNKNSDYYHFVEAFTAAYSFLESLNDDGRNDFAKILRQETKVIWYNTSDSQNEDVSDTDVDIFDRLNATKIVLNNAELIKALLLQEGNYLDVPIERALKLEGESQIQHQENRCIDVIYERDQIAIDWDNMERQLQDPPFWYFLYSSRHPYSYETHIEYLFDLIAKKSAEDKDDYYYSFNHYYEKYIAAGDDKLTFVRKAWAEISKMFMLLQEWFSDKCCYHYIGYLLEYGKTRDGKPISIPYLAKNLHELNKDLREKKLIELVQLSLSDIKSDQLVHGRKEMTQVLFLFNVETELRRMNPTSRFSFAEYKIVNDSIGWDQEHIASSVDYEPKYEKRLSLAGDLLEYFTGIPFSNSDDYQENVRQCFPNEPKAKSLCDELMKFLDVKIDEKAMIAVYDSIMSYFEATDKFLDGLQYGRKTVREKDFIWNFVLLNSRTNRSYGNSIYPVKRQRIQKDENRIYTPIGTRAVFEKAYSNKLTNMIAWGRDDAISYWTAIYNTLKGFLPEGFSLPSYIKIR